MADVGQQVSSLGHWNSPVPPHDWTPSAPLDLDSSTFLWGTEETSAPWFFLSHVPVSMLQR